MKNKILSLALAALLGLPVLGMEGGLPEGDLPGDGDDTDGDGGDQ